jgi:hypothetical protein
MVPITIRAVVQTFKDRIHTERDKAEFKALCDKYTVVRCTQGCAEGLGATVEEVQGDLGWSATTII